MPNMALNLRFLASCLITSVLSSCSMISDDWFSSADSSSAYSGYNYGGSYTSYSSRMPSSITTKGKVVVVDPNVHAWAAYEDGNLVRSGLATAGSSWCPDIGRPCQTKAGQFHIQSLGSAECKSSIYPLPKGGAPMPYCMFFNGNQGLHGSNEVVEGNISHGCVRMNVADAEWMRFNFATVGTKVIIKPY